MIRGEWDLIFQEKMGGRVEAGFNGVGVWVAGSEAEGQRVHTANCCANVALNIFAKLCSPPPGEAPASAHLYQLSL